MEYHAALSFNASLLSVGNEGSGEVEHNFESLEFFFNQLIFLGTASDRSAQVEAEFQAIDPNLHSPETLPEYIGDLIET